MEKLFFKCDDYIFCFDVLDVLLVEDYQKIKNQLEDIKIIDFKTLYQKNAHSGQNHIIFLGKNEKIIGLLVDKVLTVEKIKEISPYNNEKFMIEYVKGVCSLKDNKCYLLDANKILEGAYEK
ncbi:MAG: chemotaxis protein CheW [Calditerrivibrio sp.]|nr:chemotaxis protein CheW [Calditerrivibrio sp.]